MGSKPGATLALRAAGADEMRELARVTGYAFANNEVPKEEPAPHPLQPEQTWCAFDGERMVATSGAFEFKMRFNGQTVAADGVTVVACDPGYRRRGIVRQLIDDLLQRSRERGVPVSILWASMGAIYQRFGYGLATSAASYDIPLRHAQFQFGERAAGTVRLMEQEAALPIVSAIYRQYSGPANCMLHRGGFYWDLMLRRADDQHTYVAVYFDEADEPQAYCLYRTKWQDPNSPEPNHAIDVFDFCWLTIEGYRGVWEYLASHDLADRIRMEFVAEDDPAPSMLLEPRMLRRKTWDGVWLRVVDAEGALSARGYDSAGETVVEVVGDELCAWNNGRYRLTASGESVSVTRLSDAVSPDIVTRPDALASLVSGHSRPSDLARMGRLSITDDRKAAMLDNLFATRRRPHCPNMF